jgi:uncharacterized lipoprotein NlpE involved in copper resistance
MPYILFVKIALQFGIIVALLACPPSGVQGQQQSQCSSYARCNELGTVALKHRRFDDAIELFTQQAALAELADIDAQTKSRGAHLHSPCKLAVPAYNNLSLAYLKKRDYFRARAWTHVALRCDKNNSAAQFNLRKIDQSLGQWQWPQTLAGKYVQYAGRGTWESIIVKPSSRGNIEFCFSGLWWGLGEGPSGIGDLRATIPIRENRAEYSTHEFGENECRVSMQFSHDHLKIKQIGDAFDCGFGHNVTMNGKFERISSKEECPPNDRNDLLSFASR